ncbi:MAG: hypothetical protein ACRDT4_14340 [Micromonosporaceae bacterium]
MRTYEELVAEAAKARLPGWDLGGRMIEASTPWSYAQRAEQLVAAADGPVLDMSAGGGELTAGPDEPLPFSDGWFSVVLNRHDPYRPDEVRRVLRPDGIFLTEQVGGLDGLAINEALAAPYDEDSSDWALSTARADLETVGLQVTSGRTAFPERLFHDVGALVYFLRTVPRQVPDFSVERYDKELRLLHDQMSAAEPFRDRAVRFLIEAVRP